MCPYAHLCISKLLPVLLARTGARGAEHPGGGPGAADAGCPGAEAPAARHRRGARGGCSCFRWHCQTQSCWQLLQCASSSNAAPAQHAVPDWLPSDESYKQERWSARWHSAVVTEHVHHEWGLTEVAPCCRMLQGHRHAVLCCAVLWPVRDISNTMPTVRRGCRCTPGAATSSTWLPR